MSVRVREELVSFGAPGELKVDERGVAGGGTRLTPEALHELVGQKDVTFFDGRNAFEAQIGRFRGAVVPHVSRTRDVVAALESGRFDHLKNETIVTYCTGGNRCGVLPSPMLIRGFREAYQLDGGLVRYGETYGDQGLWNGSLCVFDQRMSGQFNKSAAVLGRCDDCVAPTSLMQNSADPSCKTQLVVCEACAEAAVQWCGLHAPAASLR